MLTMRMKKLILGVTVLAAPVVAMAQSAEQLIRKYTPLVVTAANAEALVNALRDGTEVVMYMEKAAPPPPPPPPPLFGAPLPPPAPMLTLTELVEVKCTPRTGKMGFGNVDNALTLAQASLTNLKIVTGEPQFGERKVTPEDVCFVLVGGDVTPPAGPPKITVPGILELRYQGHGWGEIAQQLELKL